MMNTQIVSNIKNNIIISILELRKLIKNICCSKTELKAKDGEYIKYLR